MTNDKRRIQRSVWTPCMGRRRFLRGTIGATGVCVGLPLLDIMLNDHATALAGGGNLPQRFGVFYWGGGVVQSTWVPSTTGYDWAAPHALEPFSDMLEYVTTVTGTRHKDSSPAHIPSRGIALSSSHDTTTGISGVGTWRGQNHPEPSVDSIVAEAWAGQAPFNSVEISITQKGPYKNNSSWKAGGQAFNRHEPSPVEVYNRLFGNGVSQQPAPDVLGASRNLNLSMMDVVKTDAEALKGRLGANDRQRMEQHLEGLRALEMRLQGFSAACVDDGVPTSRGFGEGTNNEQKAAKNQVMSGLLATALACDLTRVFSWEFSATQSESVYWEVGVDREHHLYNHENPTGEGMQNITRFIMENYAEVARALRDTPEGAGNVLDNTLIVGTSELATAGHHNYNGHPYLLLGRAGGRIKAGLHHRDPNPDNNFNAPKVLLTAVRAVGVPLERLGQQGGQNGVADRVVTDSITEIEA